MSDDVDRLALALKDAAYALINAVGLPVDLAAADGPREGLHGREPVDPDQVPAGALKGARWALDIVCCALSVLDPDSPGVVSVEEGLEALTRGPDAP
jgi:hypothetical protein